MISRATMFLGWRMSLWTIRHNSGSAFYFKVKMKSDTNLLTCDFYYYYLFYFIFIFFKKPCLKFNFIPFQFNFIYIAFLYRTLSKSSFTECRFRSLRSKPVTTACQHMPKDLLQVIYANNLCVSLNTLPPLASDDL